MYLEFFSALQNSINKMCSAFLNVKITESWLIKAMNIFEVHSNESMCRKSERIGMEQVFFLGKFTSSTIYP